MRKKIFFGVILAVFLMLMIPVNSAIQSEVVENIQTNNSKDILQKRILSIIDILLRKIKNADPEAYNKINDLFDNKRQTIPIVIKQYENGSLLKKYTKEISIKEAQIISEELKNADSDTKRIEILETFDVISKGESNSIKRDLTTLNLQAQNRFEEENPKVSDYFSFTEENTPITLGKFGILPFSFLFTDLSAFILSEEFEEFVYKHPLLLLGFLIIQFELILGSEIGEFNEQHPDSLLGLIITILYVLQAIPVALLTLPVWLSIALILIRDMIPLPFIIPRHLIWFGAGIAVGITTNEHNYAGPGNIEAELTGFSGVHMWVFGFFSLLIGYAKKVIASGAVTTPPEQ